MGRHTNKTMHRIERDRGANTPIRVQVERWNGTAWEEKTHYDVKPGDRIDVTTVKGEALKTFELED